MQRQKLFTICLIHFFVDAYASIFAPLVAIVRMNPQTIGFFATLYSFSSSFTQLLFGYLADRGALHRFVIGGAAIAAVFLCLTGPFVVDDPLLFGGALVIGGLGIAAFHPAGVVFAAQSAGIHRPFGVSLFLMTGTFGFALGPIFIEYFVRKVGRDMLPTLALFGVVLAFVGVLTLRRGLKPSPRRAREHDLRQNFRRNFRKIGDFVGEYGGSILPLYLLVVMRSMQQITVVSFLPRLMVDWYDSDALAAQANAYFIFGGAVGMMVVGLMISRWSRRWIQVVSLVGGTACLMTFLLVELPLPMRLVLLTAGGFLTLSTNSMHIIMGHEIAPRHASTVSSLMMGFGWGLGGIGPSVVSLLIPSFGLVHSLAIIASLPLLHMPLVFFVRPLPPPAPLVEAATTE